MQADAENISTLLKVYAHKKKLIYLQGMNFI